MELSCTFGPGILYTSRILHCGGGIQYVKAGMMKRIATISAVFAALLLPSSALAQSSTCQAYNPQTCPVSSVTQNNTPSVSSVSNTTTTTSSGSLPFTGLDVGLLAAGGAVLLVSGLFVRRASRRLN